jgi:hypothetical protein
MSTKKVLVVVGGGCEVGRGSELVGVISKKSALTGQKVRGFVCRETCAVVVGGGVLDQALRLMG